MARTLGGIISAEEMRKKCKLRKIKRKEIDVEEIVQAIEQAAEDGEYLIEIDMDDRLEITRQEIRDKFKEAGYEVTLVDDHSGDVGRSLVEISWHKEPR